MRPVFRTVVACVVAIAVVGVAAPAHAAPTRPDRALLQAALDAVRDAGMVGAFAEVRYGHKTWRGATGVADLATERPMRPGFQHRVGSITKTFTAVTLLQLVGEGRLGLDDPIGRYVADLVPADLASTVTVRMLLNHTSGIGDYDVPLFDSYEAVERYQRETISPRQLIEIGLAEPRTGAPGERHEYSNTNYIIAGVILERVTGHPAEREITRRIIRPLALRETYMPGSFPYIVGPHAAAYLPYPDGSLRDFSVFNMSWGWTAGALVSTTADLDVFFRALLSGRLLRPAQLAQMQTTFGDSGYGLGLYSVPLPCGGTAWGHDGMVIGHATISWHVDGARVQTTYAHNVYGMPRESIDFMFTALCGSATARSFSEPSDVLRDRPLVRTP